MKTCPRCKLLALEDIDVRNSLSRKDNKTYICNQCGTDEAMEDYFEYLRNTREKELTEREQ